MSTQNGYLLATFLVETKSRNKSVNSSKKIIALMASDGPSPHFPSLPCALALPPPRCHSAQSLVVPSFHDPKTPHALESHLERAAPLSCRDD